MQEVSVEALQDVLRRRYTLHTGQECIHPAFAHEVPEVIVNYHVQDNASRSEELLGARLTA